MEIFKRLFSNSKLQPKAATTKEDHAVDLSKVFPRLKGIFDEPTPDPNPNPGGGKMTLNHADSPVYETLAKGLGIFYAVDRAIAINCCKISTFRKPSPLKSCGKLL